MKNSCDNNNEQMNSMSRDDLIEQMKINAYTNERTIFVWEDITDDTSFIVNRMLENLEKQDKVSETKLPITIKIDSYGGSAFACLSIISKIEELKNKGYEVITVSYSKAMSAGLFITMCGTKRYAQKYCRFLLHQLQGFTIGYSSVESSKRELKDKEEVWGCMREIVKKYTKIDDKYLDTITEYDKDDYFFTDKAIELGIVDKVLGE